MIIRVDSQTGAMTVIAEPDDDVIIEEKDIPVSIFIPALDIAEDC